MPELKPEDCHYYEPGKDDFDWCPVTKGFQEAYRLACVKCHHYKDVPEVEEVKTESVSQPKIDFCVCGTALGIEDAPEGR